MARPLRDGLSDPGSGAKSQIHTQTLRGNLHVLLGFGGNITVSTGREGTLLIDDEYAGLTPKVRAALAELRSLPVKLVVNTHWHNDHTGGNEAFARGGALIIAQENAARRMRSDEILSLYGPQKAYPPIAWPAITFDKSLRLRWNGDEIDVIHVGPAHTDGDAIVFFHQQDVMATGDLFVGYNYRPPYFDDLNGGSAHGMIAAADTLLKLTDERTIVVPGHGDVTDRAELQGYRDRLVAIRDRITGAMASAINCQRPLPIRTETEECALLSRLIGQSVPPTPSATCRKAVVHLLQRAYRA